jgi:hypothetical protein
MEPTELGQLGDPRDAVLDQMEPLEEKPLLGVLALYPSSIHYVRISISVALLL